MAESKVTLGPLEQSGDLRIGPEPWDGLLRLMTANPTAVRVLKLKLGNEHFLSGNPTPLSSLTDPYYVMAGDVVVVAFQNSSDNDVSIQFGIVPNFPR